jgi:chaperone modulatory protein CbpM
MADHNQPPASGDLVTKTPELTLADLCENCGLTEELIATYVSEGIIEPQGSDKMQWRFSRIALIKVHRAVRLERDLGLNAAGVALALDLMDQVDELKRRLLQYERHGEINGGL